VTAVIFALAIRAAMGERRAHALNGLLIGFGIMGTMSADAAHNLWFYSIYNKGCIAKIATPKILLGVKAKGSLYKSILLIPR